METSRLLFGKAGIFCFKPFERSIVMESQTVQEQEALTPVEMDAGLVFSGVPTGNKIWGYQNPCLYTPAIDPHYSFHESARDAAVWFMNKLDPLYLYGPTGSGKTSLIKQLAARLNYPVLEVTGHARLEFADLCGHISLHNGTMRYEYGPLSLAMRYGGLFLASPQWYPCRPRMHL